MEDRKLNRIPLVMANEPGRAHIDNPYFVSGIVFQSCVANESVCASHVGTVATKVKLLCVMCKLSCNVCSQESCSLELECKAGGKFHVKLNICLRLIVYKYHEGNVKRTLKRKLQVPEIAGMKANDMMLFSKIAVCRHQAGCMSCAFLGLCGYTVYLALHAMTKLHVNTKHA